MQAASCLNEEFQCRATKEGNNYKLKINQSQGRGGRDKTL